MPKTGRAQARRPTDVSQGSGADDRANMRHNMTRFVWFQTIRTGEGKIVEGISYSLDLSRGGMAIVIKPSLVPGSLVFVEVVFQKTKTSFSAVCEVRYSHRIDMGHKLGLRFVALPPTARQILAAHLD